MFQANSLQALAVATTTLGTKSNVAPFARLKSIINNLILYYSFDNWW